MTHIENLAAKNTRFTSIRVFLAFVLCLAALSSSSSGQDKAQSIVESGEDAKSEAANKNRRPDAQDLIDPVRRLQSDAVRNSKAKFGHWGVQANKYTSWTNHSNRLIPVYTFGINLSALREEGSVYRSPKQLEKLYGKTPKGTVNPTAMYFDQTDIYRLQVAAIDAGYSNIVLMVFDGMDWQTARAAALFKRGRIEYESGRGRGLAFQDFRRAPTDFGLVVTSPWADYLKIDVNAQTLLEPNMPSTGGFDVSVAGRTPWNENPNNAYMLAKNKERPHTFTDSASSATSMTTGVKTFNGAINVAPDGSHLTPIARVLQDEQDFKIGIVTSVAVSHATPAAAYANNVTRKDYQDIARDLIGLPSSSHRKEPLRGVDVLIGGGFGEGKGEDTYQGDNFAPGNPYLHQDDLRKVDIKNGGEYVVATPQKGRKGRRVLMRAAQKAADEDLRLLGYFGVEGGHIPFQTADGKYNPTFDDKGHEKYTPQEIEQNPTLADMTEAALLVLEQAIDGFWLMIEAGDVDWANHANNIDNSIGAVLSGEEAFNKLMYWIEENNAWSYTAVIVTADHGHYLVIDDPERIAEAGRETRRIAAEQN